jgi:heat shock protein HtpX
MKHARSGEGFQWWGPHDRARRSAEFLLAGVATICAAYVAIVLGAIAIGIAIDRIDAEPGHEPWQHRVGLLRLAAVAIAFVGLLAAVIAFAAAGNLAARAIRLARARPLAEGEADHARRCIDNFALAVGFRPPDVFVVDDPAPNAFAARRRGSCAVCITAGALELPSEQIDALCAQTITSVSNRALPLTCAAADLVLVAKWCTKVIWAATALVLVSTIVGVPIAFAAATTIAIVLLVVTTIPLLALADRAIPRLRDDSAQLSDLDAVELTNQPAALAHLLLATAEDFKTVATPWQIAHLWFDPDTSRPRTSLSFGQRWLDNLDDRDPAGSRSTAARARRALLQRARVLVDMTSGDPKLTAQLEHAERRKLPR